MKETLRRGMTIVLILTLIGSVGATPAAAHVTDIAGSEVLGPLEGTTATIGEGTGFGVELLQVGGLLDGLDNLDAGDISTIRDRLPVV